MSANFHTAIPDPMAVTSANLESPLSELDTAITGFRDGTNTFNQLTLGSFNSKTISGGAITGDKTLVTVDTEGSAATDDLDTISSPSNGDFMMIKIANNSRVVKLRNNGGGSGNIRTYHGSDLILSNTNQIASLVYNGSNWIVLPNHLSATGFTWQAGTISSGALTYTSSYMSVDTEASAATDDLDTISGGVFGSILILSTSNNSRDVVIKHNTGNINTPNGADITLDASNKFVILVYNSATWNCVLSPMLFTSVQANTTTKYNFSGFSVPYNGIVTSGHPLASSSQPLINFVPLTGARQVRTLQAADTTLEGYGFGTLTVSGTPTNNFGVGTGTAFPGSFVRFASGGSSGNLGGVISPFTLTSLEGSPTFRLVFRTYSSLAVCRLWIGLSSAAIGNTDSPSSAGTSFIGVRYSTVVPDSFWQFVTSDGSTTTASSTTVSAATDNTYELLITCVSANAIIYFRNVANSTYASLSTSTTLPASTTALGLNARIETREAVAKSLQIYSASLYH